MKKLLHITLGLFLTHGAMGEKMLFGDAPEDKDAKALCDKIVAAYRSQGVAPAIRLLDAEGRAFIKKSGATARYDFFDFLKVEAGSGEGREDAAWSLSLTEWCYNYCRSEGDSYWLSWWTPKMHERYFEAGSYGQARAVIDYERCRLLEAGREIDVDKLKTTGPLDPAFPAIGKKTLGVRERIAAKEQKFFLSQAEQDLAEGKWRRGIEAAGLSADGAMGNGKWYMARPELTDSKGAITDYTGTWRKAQAVKAAGYRFLGLIELELKVLEEMSTFNTEEWLGWHHVLLARSRALHIKYLLGTEKAGVVMTMGEISEELRKANYPSKDDPDRVRLMIADIHFRQGNTKRGWEVLNEIHTRQDMSRDMRFEVDSEWCRQRVALGLNDGVESVLIGLLKIAREGGLKQREIGLYETYAQLLVNLGRYEDALAIQQELIRLLKSFDIFPRIPGALRELAVIQALMGQSEKAEASLREAQDALAKAKLPDDAKVRLEQHMKDKLPSSAEGYEPEKVATDLQPLSSFMVPLEGLPARGYFTLANLSGEAVNGVISFRGTGLALGEPQELGVRLNASVADGKDALTLPVRIPAGEIFTIDIHRAASDEGKAMQVALVWKPHLGDAQTATWSTDAAEEGVSLAITDAGEYLENPFYMIPVNHLLQYKDTFAQVADFRVIASAPARIELYDPNDELVFVDADGDGKFISEGDIISKDLNRNGYGDMALVATEKEMRFRLFVHPSNPKATEDLSLDLQLFRQGVWVTHSTDRLVFPKAAK